jgi:CMP/dCMP kinase
VQITFQRTKNIRYACKKHKKTGHYAQSCPNRGIFVPESGRSKNGLRDMSIIIAIDGHSSCGKSTLAKGMAKRLGYAYGDSGAMYRAVTLYFLNNMVNYHDEAAVATALEQIEIHFERIEGENTTFLNGQNVERDIRSMRVSEHVSPVSTIPMVRRAMVRQQQLMGQRRSIVMDGRDIGTVVFPDAELKIFLTAEPDVRTSRRHLELAAKGIDADWNEIRHNLLERDRIDSTRFDSPLRQADDAVVIDNSFLSEDEQLEQALALAHKHGA